MVALKPSFEKYGIFIFLVILVIVASVASPAFLGPRNIKNILEEAAAMGMVSIGQTFVILSGGGGLDLSVASVMGSAAVIVSQRTGGRNELFLPFGLLGLLFGVLVGLANGLLITKRRIPPVMATLGMMILIQGVRFIYTGGLPVGDFPPIMRFLGTGRIGSIPFSVISLAVLVGIAAIVLKKTTFGRKIYIVGGNINTARLSGYNTDWIIIAVYMICGFTAAVGGIYLTGWIGTVDNWVGKGYEIDSIAVAVMGGTSFEGGRGGVLGTIAAVFIIAILYNLIVLLGLTIHLQHAIKGTVIILAAYFYVRRAAR